MSFFGELRRRNVFRVGIAYLAAAWVLIEVVDTLAAIINAPTWIPQVVVFSAALGFPVAILLSWFYELTPEGVKAAVDVEVLQPARPMGRRIDFAIIGLLVLAVGFLIVDNYLLVARDTPLPNSVAVLPFENLSPDPDDAYFAAGVHEELLNQLAKLAALNVIARTSVQRYAGSELSIPDIAQELNVEAVMEGSVRYSDDRVRITAQLIDSETGAHLWSDTYERVLDDIFAIQSDIAMNIANALEATFSPEEAARVSAVPTENTRAYEFYLLGNAYMDRLPNWEWTPRAVSVYEEAVEEDPQFAVAWAALSSAYMVDGNDEMGEAALQRAVDLAPDLPEVHRARGRYLQGTGEYDLALEELAIAQQGLPGDPRVFHNQSRVYHYMGDLRQAVSSMAQALALDPMNAERHDFQAWDYLWLGEHEEAERHFERVLEIRPDSGWAYFGKLASALGRGDPAAVIGGFENPPLESLVSEVEFFPGFAWLAALYQRDYDAALGYLDRWDIEIDEGLVEYIPKASYYAITHRLAGRLDLAEREYRTARALIEPELETRPDDFGVLLSFAEILVGLGETEDGLRLADRLIAEMVTWSPGSIRDHHMIEGTARRVLITHVLAPAQARTVLLTQLDIYLSRFRDFSIEALLLDPRLDFIRDDPDFQALVEKYR